VLVVTVIGATALAAATGACHGHAKPAIDARQVDGRHSDAGQDGGPPDAAYDDAPVV
jgi:hypothetical protein